MATNYDNTTWFYERLSKLVFGQSQLKAQERFLPLIHPASHILVVGGGIGQILESLTRLYPAGLHITYVEVSANMLARSRQRNTGHNEVNFVQADIQAINFEQSFDAIITAFLFDNFSDKELVETFPALHQQLKPGGLWLDTDFQLTGPLWQKVLLKSMYSFFGLLGAVQVKQLPCTMHQFENLKYTLKHQHTFYGKFIVSRAWERL